MPFVRFCSVLLVAVAIAGCGKKPPATTAGPPAPSAFPSAIPSPPPPPPPPPPEAPIISQPLVTSTPLPWSERSVEEINGPDSPLKAVFFAYDSDEIDDAGRAALNANADVLRTYRTWIVTIEGHCDERGTAEYNLALGERRALAARSYLVSLGIPAERIRTVSYGKEFPFDPGHDEPAFTKNRRAHFMLTSK